jgi:hydrogenase maturation protein HypF
MTAAVQNTARLHVNLRGAVQGVGFRPFVHRLACEMGLTGWVLNSNGGLVLEAEGAAERLGEFLDRLDRERPRAAVILERSCSRLQPAGFTCFEILPSDSHDERTAGVLPDLATCPACLAEVLDPADRRFGYPFTNCTRCGPRYTIVEDLPYDRPRTTMAGFEMCPDCRREFEDPRDRRFHAQPIACPKCGPQLEGTVREAAQALAEGRIVALKGIGGFQLLVDARNAEAVTRLRRRKHREEKPLAVMMPVIKMVREFCEVSEEEQALLESPEAPIVLLRPKKLAGVAANIAPHSPYLGVMLPYSPLHHLLMRECRFPVVATSGNRSDEPIAIDNQEARRRLGAIADVFLMHNRPVARPCDDSVVRAGAVIRRARGYAPLPVPVPEELPPILAVGGHLKNAVAIGMGRQVFLSQHVGDLETLEARGAFERAIEDLCRLYRFTPRIVACDLHPEYASTRWAHASGLPVVSVQHHHAHVAACAAEHGVLEPYVGVAWDGTGYGLDGTVWGGEFFLAEGGRFDRIAHLRPFRLPGGEAAVREGRRAAAGVLWETFGPEGLPPVLVRMLERGVNAPVTTSVGRLFDAVASIAGVAQESRFEGQAAMRLERAIGSFATREAYPLPGGDWEPLIRSAVEDTRDGVGAGCIAARFHNALVQWIAAVAAQAGAARVVLSGGVFQNACLTARVSELLVSQGHTVYTHRRTPPNDGGLALGQAVLAART